MATLQTLTLDLEDMLYGIPQVERPVEDTLSTAVTNAADVAFRWTTDTLWRRGDYAEYLGSAGTAGEIVILAGDHSSGTDVTVRRAQKRTSAAAHTAIGTATYDETGGAQEDLWTTSAAHGKSVGDQVIFSSVGTGATGYAANTTYYVVSVPLTTTLTLSATSGGSAIAGTGDSAGTWTMVTPAYNEGTVWRRNPLFDRTMIQRAISECVDSDISPECWYRSQRTLTPWDGLKRYDVNASDFLVEQVYQVDTAQASVGNATFANAGDLWTLTAHGLSVGDMVRFTAAGSAPTEYAATVIYWVAAVASANTFQLSATDSTTVLVGSADSVGTWTLAKINGAHLVPMNPAMWEIMTNVDTTTGSTTGRVIRLKNWYSTGDTLHYTARTHPSSSAISSLPTDITDMIPYGAMARLLSWVPVPARADLRRTNRVGDKAGASQPFIEAQYYAAKFEEMKRRYKRKMLRELPAPLRYRSNRQWSG